MRRLSFAVLLILFLVSCSMSIPPTAIYRLYIPADSIVSSQGVGQAVIIIASGPNYLNQPYIAYKSTPYKIETSQYAKWDAPPVRLIAQEFQNILLAKKLFKAVTVSLSPYKDKYTLYIHLKKFERLDEGERSYSELEFDIEIFAPNSDSPIYTRSIYKKNNLSDKTFLETARGISASLTEALNELNGSLTLK